MSELVLSFYINERSRERKVEISNQTIKELGKLLKAVEEIREVSYSTIDFKYEYGPKHKTSGYVTHEDWEDAFKSLALSLVEK